ncbi:MAG TPA: GNAT family N-acetyltransferase [Solirubrobacteraceae bacterium]|jgi:CelD/BcsL family acetyltransferase involved in cellulose biosynthesis|nr:GNAT family N-acetyltransferase [Solirubrobacteraceae bacterium]
MDAKLITDLDALEDLAPQWDALAIANEQPSCAPVWLLAWLKQLAPGTPGLRLVAVHDGDELIGIAPFFLDTERSGRVDYRLLGAELGSRLAPLAAASREWEVAGAVAGALAEANPRPDLIALEGVPPGSPWLIALRNQWPGRIPPLSSLYNVRGSPTVQLRGSFADWLATRSSSFRKNHRRRSRMLTEAGGAIRLGTIQTLSNDISALMRLHAERWSGRGTSSLVAQGDRFTAMLEAAGRELTPSGRFRIWLVEIDGQPIWANLFLAAGGELLAVNSGWDERWRKLSPATLGMVRAIEDAFERGERRLDLGIGEDPYKLEFADGDDPVGWGMLIPSGRRMALTILRTSPMLLNSAARRTAKRTLTPERIDALRGLRRRLRP